MTGSSVIVLAAMLSSAGHVPAAALALILGIDRFMSEARALTNLIGNGVATIVVAKWCGQLDDKVLQKGLRQGPGLATDATSITRTGYEAAHRSDQGGQRIT